MSRFIVTIITAIVSTIVGMLCGIRIASNSNTVKKGTDNVMLDSLENNIRLEKQLTNLNNILNNSEVDNNTKKLFKDIFSNNNSYMTIPFIKEVITYMESRPKGWSIYKTNKEEKIQFLYMIGVGLSGIPVNELTKLLQEVAYEIGIPKDNVPSI